jgi:hypothetical protein
MDPLRVDLVTLRRPVEVQFPNEKWFRIEPFRAHGKALQRAWEADPTNADLLVELLKLAAPDATDEDLATLSVDEDIPRVLAHADGKAALMEAYLKNELSGGARPAPSHTQGSSPTTNSSGSSGTSPEATGSRSSRSTTNPTTKPSSTSRRSRKSNASPDSSKSHGTSTTSGIG